MADPIEHVVVLMLENNSFDRMLGCMNAVYPSLEVCRRSGPFTNPDYPDTSRTVTRLPTEDRAYSSRNAAIGSILEAFRAGR